MELRIPSTWILWWLDGAATFSDGFAKLFVGIRVCAAPLRRKGISSSGPRASRGIGTR